jgi:cytochrome c peroxidase
MLHLNRMASGSVAVVTAIAVMVPFYVATSHAQAVVGQSVKSDIVKAPAASLEKTRSEYRRPKFISFPKENPYTAAKAALGKKLFFDTRLSDANAQSCASCHNPGYGWGDGQPKGIGNQMQSLARRSPTIINAAYGQIFMWDGQMDSLEDQALGPITTPAEMGLTLETLMQRLNSVNEYAALFESAFPGQKRSAADCCVRYRAI